jgi:hypothetical protein
MTEVIFMPSLVVMIGGYLSILGVIAKPTDLDLQIKIYENLQEVKKNVKEINSSNKEILKKLSEK